MNLSKSIVSEIQFAADYDVVVVGGGTTGCCAALAAARGGAGTVAIVDAYGFLGGFAVSKGTWLGFHAPDGRRVVAGIPMEIVDRVATFGGTTEFYFDPIWNSSVYVNPTWLKVALADMMREVGIEPYLHSLATAVRKSDDATVSGVIIHNKQGCQLLHARMVVDCTDSADVAVAAGARTIFGRASDSKPQVASMILDVGDVDMDALFAWFTEHPDEIRPFPLPPDSIHALLSNMRKGPVFGMGAFPSLVAKAVRDGVEFPRDRLVGIGFPQRGEMKLVTSRVENVNPNDVRNCSAAEMEGLQQIKGIMRFINNYMPGGKNAKAIGSSHQIGLRETRHIEGDYQLTGNDLMAGKPFDDVIALGAYHLDVHSPDHKGLESQQPPTYQIPYRSLLPRGLDNLLVAGRCIAADHAASASTRVIAISAAQGQAAGTAAAMACATGNTTREVNVGKLQSALRQQGAELNMEGA